VGVAGAAAAIGGIFLHMCQRCSNLVLTISSTHLSPPLAPRPTRQPPAAHGGFSGRSVAVPIDKLYAQAAACKKRLVLCGHSLGGAVALLCTIKLLRIWAARQLGGTYKPSGGAGKGRGGGSKGRQGRQRRNNQHLAAAAAAAAAAPYADPNIRCITFAAPAVANESLAAEVVAAGWDRLISNFVQPGECIFETVLCEAAKGRLTNDKQQLPAPMDKPLVWESHNCL